MKEPHFCFVFNVVQLLGKGNFSLFLSVISIRKKLRNATHCGGRICCNDSTRLIILVYICCGGEGDIRRPDGNSVSYMQETCVRLSWQETKETTVMPILWRMDASKFLPRSFSIFLHIRAKKKTLSFHPPFLFFYSRHEARNRELQVGRKAYSISIVFIFFISIP